MTNAQLRGLRADSRGFDPNRQAIRCDTCWHLWRLVWIPDRLELLPAAPLGRVVEDKACADCEARLKKWNESHGDAILAGRRRRRAEADAASGLIVTGING